MAKRTRRLILAGAAVMLLALVPGSAGATTVDGGHTGGGCNRNKAEAPSNSSY